MRYWIIVNNRQAGPFELEQLPGLNVLPTTPVWHEGLSQWVPAAQVPEIVALFQHKQTETTDDAGTTADEEPQAPADKDGEAIMEDAARDENETTTYSGICDNVEQNPYRGYYPQQSKKEEADRPEKPSSYLGWAVASTLLCCLPLGVVAIIYSASVNSKYDRGDYKGAEKASEKAQWWIMLAITLGLVLSPFQSLLQLL